MSAPRETLEQTLRRLKQEREDADLRYNQALTELDRALAPPVGIPDVPVPIDDERLAARQLRCQLPGIPDRRGAADDDGA